MSKRSKDWSIEFEDVNEEEDGNNSENITEKNDTYKKKNNLKSILEEETLDNLHFEDPYEDDMEDSEHMEQEENQMNEEMNEEEELDAPETIQYVKQEIEEEKDVKEEEKTPKRVYRPGVDALEPEEILDYESTAYNMLHRLNVEWPCLSIDILRDSLGEYRTKYPHTMYMVTGTQADKAKNNKINVVKLSDLRKTIDDDGDDNSDDDDSDEEDDPLVEERSFSHYGGVNRIRSCPQQPHMVASWADTGKISIWNIEAYIKALDAPVSKLPKAPEVYSFTHSTEGFAMDWSPCSAGRLVTADCNGKIYLSNPSNNSWTVEKNSFNGHKDSVEDLQFSPNENDIFISCSVDKSIKVWDCRAPKKAVLSVELAHDCDINVISWNKKAPHLLASGAEDGSFKVWSLKNFVANAPLAHFKWHKDQVSSIEWHPHEESTLAVASSDNTISIWDMSLENDPEESATGADLDEDVPPQLLFVHQGQTDLRELHFHPQIPSTIVSTAGDGFNVFHPSNM